MKRLILILTLISFVTAVWSQTFTNHTYSYNNSVFNNPERGFYRYTERNNSTSSLSINTLQSYSDDGFTLIYRIFYIGEFVNSPISQAYLDKMREDFSRMRAAGIKGVIRFAYTASMNAPYGDATPERVNQHIEQLKPILIDNSDVIFVLQAGFIGAWGEWYYTDHFATGSPDNVTEEDLLERKVLVNNLLNALPEDRMIQLRYVGYKMQLFDSIPVSPEEAYSGSPKSRISHHNDCFVSSSNDVGSYRNIVFEKNYLEEDTKYTSIGGETCAWYELRSNCDTSVYEMERFHWSFINQDYFGQTINEWMEDGCYTEMQKNLGYRYYLTNAEIQDSGKHNSSFSIAFNLMNIGYSNPVNPRDIEIVIQNKTTGERFYSPINIDLRKYELNSAIEISTEIGIPSYVPYGEYYVFLNLPDPKPTLRNNPDFSIRLANILVWSTSTGLNSFQHTLCIDENTAGFEPYAGSNYFLADNSIPSTQIIVDGDPSDWNLIETAGSNAANSYLHSVKTFRSADTVFYLLQGTDLQLNSQIFIDADHDAATGMDYWSWTDDGGIDYLVQNNELFEYNDINGSSNWNWNLLSDEVLRTANDTAIELAIPVAFFSSTILNDSIRFGVKNISSDWTTIIESVPGEGNNLISYHNTAVNPPRLFLTSYSNNVIVGFAFEEDDTNTVIVLEKSTDPDDHFTTCASISSQSGTVYFRDSELTDNTTYYYRAYFIRNDLYSPYSEIEPITTGSGSFKYPVVNVDANDDDWNAIPPLGAISEADQNFILKVYCSADYVNILLSGDAVSSYSVYIDTDNDALTGENNPDWNGSGFEFKCSSGVLYQYLSGSYTEVTEIDSLMSAGNLTEFKIPVSLLELDDSQAVMNFSAELSADGKELFIPYNGSDVLVYGRILPAERPENFSVRQSVSNPSGKLIASWDKSDNCEGYLLVRTNMSSGIETQFELLPNEYQLIDDGLDENTAYEYSLFGYNFAGKSEDAGPFEISTAILGMEETPDNHDILVWPNPVKDELNIRFPQVIVNMVNINICSIDGRNVFTRNFKVNASGTDQVFTIPLSIAEGVYFMQVQIAGDQFVKKIIVE